MGTRPPAEVDVTPQLVRGLLLDQHPDLADLPLGTAAAGWDNVMLRLGDRLAVRVPRRAAAAPLMEHEQRWLPVVAPLLPVPVPLPVRVGRPSERYPWAWSVVPWLAGRSVAALAPVVRRALAAPLADAVVALHVPAPADAPPNPVRGGPLQDRDAAVVERLATGLVPDVDAVRSQWHRALGVEPWRGPPVWLHGDLHPANLLADARGPGTAGRLAAVLDFGDVTAGDPATDLATAWLTFDAAGRREFRAHVTARTGRGAARQDAPHRAVDDATWQRARGWALVMATALLTHSDDDPALAALGRHAIAQVLAD